MINKYLYALILLIFSVSIYAQETKKDVNNISREEVLQMNIEELSAYDLEEIMKLMDIVGASTIEELYELLLNKDVTSASKSEESLFDSPLSTTVLSYEEIVTNGATSIEEALKLVPGVIVREKTNGVYDVQIRGGQNMPMNNMLIYAENTTTLVMIDGRPVFNYGMGGILWETLPISLGELDRIEVVRGPSSALYGPNAVNGVINLISKKTTDETPIVSANFQGGSLSTYIGDVSIRKKFNDKITTGVAYYFEQRDRNSDKLYAFYDDEYLDLETYGQRNNDLLWSNDVASELFDDPSRAKEKMGINAYFDYIPNDELSFNLSAGYLDDLACSSTIGDNPTPYNDRTSYGYYTNLIGNIYGFNLQMASNNVIQNFNKGHKGWVQATSQYNISLDYLLQFNKLSVRPGLSYQSVYYDDRDYIDNIGEGYFNDRVALRNFAISARFDYNPIEKLRLVAALRSEKYNVPDEWKPSYQFVASYKINDNNLFRAVYSRANQSTFMINAFSNYTWDRDGLGSPEFVHFAGSDNPNLMTMDMIELGYRTRPSKRLLIDIEAFYNKAKDFSALMPDSMRTMVYDDQSNINPVTTLYTSHRPLDIKSKQYGLTVSADMVLSEKLIMKAHLTYQKTTVDNFMDYSRNDIALIQGTENTIALMADVATYPSTGIPPKPYYSSTTQPSKDEYKDDVDNEAIPSFWGSLSLTYKPLKKLDITAQSYYYDSYFLYTQYDSNSNTNRPDNAKYTGNINNKFTLNAKVNYKINNNINVFVNARNILDNNTQEYPFMDKIGGLYLAGFSLNF